MMSNDSTEPAARVFISYAHADNDLHSDAIRNFCDDLCGFFFAETGRQLEAFFDRTSIGWGENWRSSIESALLGATVFMPIVTMQYFTRPACREELNAFHANAQRLGAGFLILPVVIAGASRITSTDARPEVRLIESLQFEDLQDAFLAGHGTREWREALRGISNKLADVLERAERDVSLPPGIAVRQDASTLPGALEDTEPDLLEQFRQLEEGTARVTREVEATLRDLTTWGEVLTAEMDARNPSTMTQEQMRVFCIQLARKISDPSLRVQQSGSDLSTSVTGLDANLRGMLEMLGSINLPEARQTFDAFTEQMRSTFGTGELNEVAEQMTTFLDQMRVMEVLSSPLRRALRPARLGFERLRDATRVIDGWGTLGLTNGQ